MNNPPEQATVLAAEPQTAPAPSGSSDAPPKAKDAPPPALVEYMLQGWAPRMAEPVAPLPDHEAYAARRRALSKLFPAETLIIPTGHEKVRANDTHYRFRPASDFFYLTGNPEPDAVLVMQPQEGGGHRDILFVHPNPHRDDATFFTDREKGELWVGGRLGVPESQARFGVHECRPLAELDAMLESLNTGVTRPWRLVRGHSARIDGKLPEHERDSQFTTALSEQRLIKDEVEIREMRGVIDATLRGFEDVIRALPTAESEREVEGIFALRARVVGNDVGYGIIAAAGPHACILHWTHNNGALRRGDLLLLDAGVEGNSLYTADITRTMPISGRFDEAQRMIYELVYKAQQAAFAQIRPGNDFMDPNRAAMRVLAEGLSQLGILQMSVEEALKEDKQFYKRYSLHNISHMLGLDVHDCAKARDENYKYGKLEAGMVLTIEPGLYLQRDDLTVPERFRGIGVRIEDDVLVTANGYENLSAHIPSHVDDVEAWMQRLWKGKGT